MTLSDPSPYTPPTTELIDTPVWQNELSRLALSSGFYLHGFKEMLLLIPNLPILVDLHRAPAHAIAHLLVNLPIFTLVGGLIGRWFCFRQIRLKFRYKIRLRIASGLTISALGMLCSLVAHTLINLIPGAPESYGSMSFFTWALWVTIPTTIASSLHLAHFLASATRQMAHGRYSAPKVSEPGKEPPDGRVWD